MSISMHLGNSRELLAAMPESSVDAIVTDPPYEIDFMGKGWDRSGIAFDPEFWALLLRVLKPAGHLVSFGACRTYHRIAVGIEDGGFQIRDCLQWIFGSGFPKSLNASFAINKELSKEGLEKEHLFTKWMRGTGITSAQINEATRTQMGGHYLTSPSQPAIPTSEIMERMRHLLPEVPAWIEREITERENRKAEARDRNEGIGFLQSLHVDREALETIEHPEAKAWEGWGTAIKPSYEPIVLARKPPESTIARSLLKSGVGALNINGCRLECAPAMDGDAPGRWPPNVLLSPESAKKFGSRSSYFPIFDWSDQDHFFYAAKASRPERELGCENLPIHVPPAVEGRKEGSAGLSNPRAGSGRTSSGVRNFHPTVKPVSLMRWLCRLITPPGGLVLDPFAGSGTTGVGAISEGFGFIGMEMDPGHHSIAMARLEHASSSAPETNREDYKPPAKRQMGLFG